MKHEKIDNRARVWVVTLGPDGRLEDRIDPDLIARLADGASAEEIAKALGNEVARSRTW